MSSSSIRRLLHRLLLLPIFVIWMLVGTAQAAFTTTVPVSERSATDMAVSMFPIMLKLKQANLYLTDPEVLFLSPERIGIRTSFQAYDHRPAEGIAMSEDGLAMLSARVAYDRSTRQVLLIDARIEQLRFDRSNDASQHFSRVLDAAWASEITDPIRADLPPHPYLAPFKNNIDNILYDGKHITLVLGY